MGPTGVEAVGSGSRPSKTYRITSLFNPGGWNFPHMPHAQNRPALCWNNSAAFRPPFKNLWAAKRGANCKLGIPFIQGRNGARGHSYGPTSFLQQQRHSLYPAPFSPSSEHRLSLSLANLKKYTKYAVVVQAYNRLGAGPRSEEINVMTGEDGM